MKSYKIIIVLMASTLLVISLSFLLISFMYDIGSGTAFLSKDELYVFDQIQQDKFYKDYPEMISKGDILDVKYTLCRESDPYGSEFIFLFKGEKVKKIINLEIHFKTENDGKINNRIKVMEYVSDYEFYEDLNYNKDRNKPRIILKTFDNLLGVTNPTSYDELINEYGNNLSVDEFTFVFTFKDRTNEKHHVIADKEKSLSLNSYTLDKTMEEIIEEYNGPVDFIQYYNDTEGDINKLLINLEVQYQIYTEKGLSEIYRFYELIENSKNRKKILENEAVFSVFSSSSLDELNIINLEKIIDHIKKLYRYCNFEAGTTGYSSFYSMVDLVNEAYEIKTGKSIVTGNFKNLEMSEVLEMLDEINFN